MGKRATLLYAAAGWVLLQLADIGFPRLGFPDSAVKLNLVCPRRSGTVQSEN
jgi:hypothetical protein